MGHHDAVLLEDALQVTIRGVGKVESVPRCVNGGNNAWHAVHFVITFAVDLIEDVPSMGEDGEESYWKETATEQNRKIH